MPLHKNPPKVRSKIAAMGNAKLREMGKIYKFTSETAKAAVEKRRASEKIKKLGQEQRYKDELTRLRRGIRT